MTQRPRKPLASVLDSILPSKEPHLEFDCNLLRIQRLKPRKEAIPDYLGQQWVGGFSQPGAQLTRIIHDASAAIAHPKQVESLESIKVSDSRAKINRMALDFASAGATHLDAPLRRPGGRARRLSPSTYCSSAPRSFAAPP